MVNKLEFWIGLAAAVLLGAAMVAGGEYMAAWITQMGLGDRLLGVSLADPMLLGSLAIAFGSVLWMLIGWVIPALSLNRQVGDALEEDPDNGKTAFKRLDERLGGGLRPALAPTGPGFRAENGRILLKRHAGSWFFRRLPLAALALGSLLALIALALGHAGELQYVRDSAAADVERPGLEGSVLALACFATVATGALISALLYWLTGGPVAARLDRLIAMLRPEPPKSTADEVEARIDQTMAPAIAALSAAADRLAKIEERAVHDGVAWAAGQFIEQVEKATGARAESLAETMAAMERSAASLLTAMEAMQGRLAEEGTTQAAQLAQGYAETQAALLEEFRAVAGEMRAMTATAVESVTEQVRQTRDATQEALRLLSKEAGGAKSIREAADQMLAAAKASRETVERFIALAERMRDLNQTIAATSSAQADIAAAAASLGRIEPPLTSPETARRLSDAIKSLKQSATQPLPDL